MSRNASVSHLAVPTVLITPDMDWDGLTKRNPDIKQGVLIDVRKTDIEGATEALIRARAAGIPVFSGIGNLSGLDIPMLPGSAKGPFSKAKTADEAASSEAPAPRVRGREPAMVYDQRVRSGQQIVAENRDLIVTGPVSQGSELISDGSVHIYGPMCGRVFAGHGGDTTARVYCLSFRPDLISIAGNFQIFESIDPELLGQSVMLWLEDGQLLLKRLEA